MSNENPSTEPAVQVEERPRTIGHYQLSKTIGEGTFGKVKLSTHTPTGEKVAVKILEKDKITDVNDVERVAREIHILKLIRHPNIIQLYEIIETPKQLYLVMEYANGGELFEYIVANNRIKEKEACRFFRQIISGVEYIHKLGVVHRDLKPENLLLDYNMNIKIVDFGLSNTYKEGQTLKTACGSPCYAAPEMIAGKRYNGLQVDIWSCGVILFAMLCGYLPFEDANTSNLYKKILNGDFQIPKFVSNEARDLLKNILNTDPQKRYNIEDIRSHPWYNLVRTEREPEGIIIGVNPVPVDYNILQKLEALNFSANYAKKCIEANKHNHVTTSYYLLLLEHLRNGGVSNADMSSPNFVSTTFAQLANEEGSSSSQPKRNASVSSPTALDSTGISPTHKLNQSLTPVEIEFHGPVVYKVKPTIINSAHLNLNNLDTSLTKEFDRTILSNAHSPKNKSQNQSLSIQKEKSDSATKKVRPDTSQRERLSIKKAFFSPVPKQERIDANLICVRHTSNPEAITETHKLREKDLIVEKTRKDSEPMMYYVTEYSRQIPVHEKALYPSGNKKGVLVQSERYNTEGCRNVITEAEVVYETISSSRRTPEKASSSTKQSEKAIKSRKSSSPKPSPNGIPSSLIGAKNIYAAYKVINTKHLSIKSPRKAQDKSLNVSVDRTLKDNYLGASIQKKLFVSPRAVPVQERPSAVQSGSNRKGVVSTSLGFAPGALKEKSSNTNNTSVVDRLNNHTTGMKIHKGPFHLNSVTTKNPKFLMSEIAKVLENNKIYYRNMTKYSLKCEKDTNKFEIEINGLQNHENLYIIRFIRQSGDITKSNEICSLIYRSLDM